MEILRFLKENKEARKIFGKKELEIIEKQLLGINLTQSERNRLSRDIRVKFEFIKKLAGFEPEFKLKKGSEIKKIVEETKNIILDDELFKKIKQIILFGSFVENKMTFRSDIDIAVKFDNLDLKEATKFRLRISGRINEKADVQVYNVLPPKIKEEIDEKGRILYDKQNS